MIIFEGSKYLYFVTLAADIIAFITGTSMAWSSPVLPILEGDDISKIPLGRQVTGTEASWIGSLSAMGGIFGPLIFGFLVEKIGRKSTVLVIVIPFLTAYVIAAFAKIVELYYLSRILMGMGVGGMYCILPIFVVETAEDANRGTLLASITCSIMLGLLFSYCVGPFVSIMTFNLILSAVCIIYVPIFWFVAPETPYYLASMNEEEDALKSLGYLRRKPKEFIKKELESIKEHLNQLKPASFLEIFKTKGTTKAFFHCIALTTFEQFSGVNVIRYFSENIFNATGGATPPEICSIIVGSVQFVVSVFLPPFLDKAGRKVLLYFAVTGAIFAEGLLGLYFYLLNKGQDVSQLDWLPVFSMVMFISFFSFGMGSIPWATMGEILPLNIISKATLTITSFYWFVGFFLTKYFGALSDTIGMAGSFWIFAGCCVGYDLFVYFFMVETKGRSLQEIQSILNK